MSRQDELRARAHDLLARAKAEESVTESLVCLLHAMECDQEADLLNGPDFPHAHVIGPHIGGGTRETA